MERGRDAADADLAEQIDDDDDAVEVPPDAPEADVLDQHRPPSAGAGARAPTEIPPEVPEADALDQSRAVPYEDDDSREE
jgi:hypothetical protein